MYRPFKNKKRGVKFVSLTKQDPKSAYQILHKNKIELALGIRNKSSTQAKEYFI